MSPTFADELELLALGCRWRVSLDGLPRPDRLRTLWSRCAGLAKEEQALVLSDAVATSASTIARCTDVEAYPSEFSRALTRWCLDRLIGPVLLLHAAALADLATGDAVVVIGASGAGKSTLARMLGRRFAYLTDECVAVAGDFRLAPYPKPLSLRDDRTNRTNSPLRSEASPDELGLLPTPSTATVVAAVLLRRDPSCPAPSLTAVSMVDALAAAAPQTSSLARTDDGLARLAGCLGLNGGPWVLQYADLARDAPLVGDLLAGLLDRSRRTESAPSRVAWTYVPPGALVAPDEEPTTDSPRWRRAPHAGAVVQGGQVAVLLASEIVSLDGVGAALWLMADSAQTLDELTSGAIGMLGDHCDVVTRVRAGIARLVEIGVLEQVGRLALEVPVSAGETRT